MPFPLTTFIFAGDGALVGATVAVIAAVNWLSYLTASSVLGQVRAAPSVRISDLGSLLETDDSAAKGDGMLVFVRGEIQTQPSDFERCLGLKNHGALVSECCDGRRAVIIHHNDVVLSEGFGLLKEFLTFKKSIPFGLVDNNLTGASLLKVNLKGSAHTLPLEACDKVLQINYPSPPFPWSTISKDGETSRNVMEAILPIGKEITALGVCRKDDHGSFNIESRIQVPYFLTDRHRADIEEELSKRTNALFWSTIALGALSVTILGFSIYRNWSRKKEAKQRREEEMKNARVGFRLLL